MIEKKKESVTGIFRAGSWGLSISVGWLGKVTEGGNELCDFLGEDLCRHTKLVQKPEVRGCPAGSRSGEEVHAAGVEGAGDEKRGGEWLYHVCKALGHSSSMRSNQSVLSRGGSRSELHLQEPFLVIHSKGSRSGNREGN